MSIAMEYLINEASEAEIAEHLRRCDGDFRPPLSSRVRIDDYARKIASKAMRFEARSGGRLAGLLAVYCNDRERSIAFITSVSVVREFSRHGVAAQLLRQCIQTVRDRGMRQISLEVAKDNVAAIGLYAKNGFLAQPIAAEIVSMTLLC